MIIVLVPENSGNCICSDNKGHTEAPEKPLAHREEQPTARPRKKCCPYNFDGKICRPVGDRILCGYDRNVGQPEDNYLDLQNGCRIKNGRLECGYFQPPYTYSPRPPVTDDVNFGNDGGDDEKLLFATETIPPSPSPHHHHDNYCHCVNFV